MTLEGDRDAAPSTLRAQLVDAAVSEGGARMQHGDRRRTHRARGRGPQSIRVGWRVEVGGPVAAQVTASLDEGTLYVATLAGELVALARADGAPRWTAKLGERAYATPLVHDDGSIWVGSDAKKMFALSPRGEVVHRLDLDGEADTGALTTLEGNVVFAAGNQVLSVRRTGELAWRFAAKSKVFTAPALAGELVVFGSQDDSVYAVDVASGALVWRTPLGADVDGAPVVGEDGSISVGTDRGEVVRLASDGGALWAADAGGYVRGALSLARNGDVLAGTYGPAPRVVRLGNDGALRGAFAVPGTGSREFGIHGAPVEDDEGALYFGAQDDAVYAIDPGGSVRWRFQTGADVDAPLTLLSDGSLVVPSEDGSVTLLVP